VFVVSSEIWRKKRQQKRLIVPLEEQPDNNDEVSTKPEENTV